MTKTERRNLCISLPIELYNELKERAKEDQRSLGPYIKMVLAKHFEKNKLAKTSS